MTEFPAVVIQKADKPGERQDSRGHVFQAHIFPQKRRKSGVDDITLDDAFDSL